MIRFEKTARISRKGQITLPKAVRDLLQTGFVRVIVDDGEVRLEPVENVGGSLKRHAGGHKHIFIEETREQAWDALANRKRQRR